MGVILWLLAVVLVVAGVVRILQGDWIVGAVLIVLGFAVGPGGWSILR